MLGMVTASALLPVVGSFFPSSAFAYASPDLCFKALYQGAPVGVHCVAFRSDGDLLVVTSRVEIKVKVLFFTAYHYTHQAEEIWHSGRLVSVESTTFDNGTHLSVSGRAAADGFRIKSTDGPFLADGNLLTTDSLWNSQLVRESKMIDVQNGCETGLVVKPLGKEEVITPQGRLMANRFQIITPDYAGSLFFDDDGRWVKSILERQGETLEYALVS